MTAQLALDAPGRGRRIVVGVSGGVTSAWCWGWALRTFPRSEVIGMFHDTKEEHSDTYRFNADLARALDSTIVDVSDGRSVTELFEETGYLGNNQQSHCSRVLKREQGDRFVRDLITAGFAVTQIYGFSGHEPDRIARAAGRAYNLGIGARFPLIEERTTKQQCADWCESIGVRPSAMYCWSDHANCVGCVKGGRAYWLAVAQHHPDVFEQRAQLEERFGHTIIRGENPISLRELVQVGLKRPVDRREAIEIGACECGD